ncbi:MAG: S-layer homology domain-containing protein [Clostridiales bacterium]|nr:S-layer homology domain-containing protein [Clostridiales bacterium]
MKKKMISLLLCAAMLIGLLPTVALADGEPFTADIRVDGRGMAVSVDGATKVESSDDEYKFDDDAESVTVTITRGENYHGIRVRSFGEGADGPWSRLKLEDGIYTITDLTKSYEIEVFDWEPNLYDNEFVVGYEQSDDFTVQLKGETVEAWGDVETFTEEDFPLTITTSEPSYKVVVRPNDSDEIELLRGEDNSYTYNPTTNVNAGFELIVYRTEEEYAFDTISYDWENEFIAEYQVRFDGCEPDSGCTVTYQADDEGNLVQAMSYNGRTRLVLANDTTQVKLTITAAGGYIYEIWADGQDVTESESVVGNVYTWTFAENSDIRPEIVFRSENDPGPGGDPIPENGIQFQLHGPERGTVSYKIGNAEAYTTVGNTETESTDVNSNVITVENESTVTFKVQPEVTDGHFEVHIDSNPAEEVKIEWDTESYDDFMESLAAGESVSFTAKPGVGYSISVQFGLDEIPWYTVSWDGGNVTVENGEVLVERVYVPAHDDKPDTIYTAIESEYNESETDNIFSLMDTIGKEKEDPNDPAEPDAFQQYGIGFSQSDLFISKDLEGVRLDFKFKPDYGYQLYDIRTNETESLLSDFTASVDEISTFTFAVRQGGNVHFNVVFAAAEDTIDVTGSEKVTGASIADGGNATDSGNLKMIVKDMTDQAIDALGSDMSKATLGENTLYLDMNLYQVVSKGGGNGNWENQLENLSGTITVTLSVPAPAEGSSYYIIREHGDGENKTYDRIAVAYDAVTGTVTFETDKFSNYALAQAVDNVTASTDVSGTVSGAAIDTNTAWADALPAEASAATSVKLTVADSTPDNETKNTLASKAGGAVDEVKSFYLDLTMSATVGSSDTPITDLRQPVTVTLEVPALLASETYAVVRQHGTEYTALPCTYDRTASTLTVQSDKFSTYAIFVVPATADFTAGDNGVAALALLNAAKTGTEDSTWDSDTKALTLKGVDFTTSATTAVKLSAGSTIVLADGTTNTITGGSTASGGCYGIYAEGNLTITIPGGAAGTGTLTVTGGDITAAAGAMPFESTGIYACGSVTISGGTVNATGGNITRGNGTASFKSYGIYAGNGVTISGGIVTAQSSTAPNRSYGIYAESGNIAVTGGIVTATGRAAYYSYGIDAHAGSVTIENGGKVIAASGTTGENGAGIYAYGSVTISGSTTEVTANGDTAGNNSYGIEALNGDVTINGGTVRATGGNAAERSYGIYAKRYDNGSGGYAGGNIDISGGAQVTAQGGGVTSEGGLSYGLFAYESMTISGNTTEVTVQGGDATSAGSESYGIRAFWGDVTINGGIVRGTGGKAVNSCGIYANEGKVIIENGEVNATGGEAINTYSQSSGIYAGEDVAISNAADVAAQGGAAYYSYGIYASGDLTISGGTVDTKGGTASSISSGIRTYSGDVTISGSAAVTATGDTSDDSYGIDAFLGSVKIEGGEVTATGGTATDSFSYGISAEKNVTVTGGNITATGSAASGYSAGISAGDNATISGTAVVTATSGAANYESFGIEAYSGSIKITITNGAVIAKAASATKNSALSKTLAALPSAYQWRLSNSGDYSAYPGSAYTWNAADTYVEIRNTASNPDPGTPVIPAVTTYPVTAAQPENGAVIVSPANAAAGVTVTVTVTPDAGYELNTLTVTDTGGKEIALTDKSDGTYTFTMPAGKVTVNAAFSRVALPFTDVPADAYYYDAVAWAVENKITEGNGGGTTFSPNANCTRGEIVTFLWRAAGCPEPKSSTNPFTDVEEGSYYFKAVLWAVENGITDGIGDAVFSPDTECTRGQAVTFLHRSAEFPTPGAGNGFADVKADDYFASAVDWAVANGITDGTGNNCFSPESECTRGQIATFLYRWLVK